MYMKMKSSSTQQPPPFRFNLVGVVDIITTTVYIELSRTLSCVFPNAKKKERPYNLAKHLLEKP